MWNRQTISTRSREDAEENAEKDIGKETDGWVDAARRFRAGIPVLALSPTRPSPRWKFLAYGSK